MKKTEIRTTRVLHPQIYAWYTPDIPKYKNWVKIGYTTRTAEQRIKEQASQIIIDKKELWHYDARFMNGQGYFDDHDLHDYLTRIKQIPREKGSEWFDYTPDMTQSERDFQDFVFQRYDVSKTISEQDYQLRNEQTEAVFQAKSYFDKGGKEFLWNAKPRFGKTLAAYDLVRKLDAVNILIVTNRPAIANSWFDDYEKFIRWQTSYLFVSETDALKDRPTLSRNEFVSMVQAHPDCNQIAFISLQDLKGSKYFGDGPYDKLKWVADTSWDLLVIDEAHEGIDTFKTDKAFNRLTRKWTLHLSGTPFKALASDKFTEEQVYTWSYEDEQAAKNSWSEDRNNPYEDLPTLNLFTYQLSQMMTDKVNQGTQVDDEELPYYFDLNEFFAVNESGKFIYEADVIRFLDILTHNEKYPFSTPELRYELKHTFWLLNRVASARALAKLLKNHPVFQDYEVVIAAGNGKEDNEAEDVQANEASLARVLKAIEENNKTITLSVGQLTTGITVKPWTAVLMLSNIKSPSIYMQAAFRAQNAYSFEDEKGNLKRKENAYVFDFAPERTLILFDEFANNLKKSTANGAGTSQERKANIQTLLNFLPVVGEDTEGKMIELDAEKVLTIPHKLKATEVVRHGFMSNFLFANISSIFQAPSIVQETLNKLEPAKEGKKKSKIIDTSTIETDENGDIQVSDKIVINKTEAIFGDEKVVEVTNDLRTNIETIDIDSAEKFINQVTDTAVKTIRPDLETVEEQFENVHKSDIDRMQKTMQNYVEQEVKEKYLSFDHKQAEIKRNYEGKLNEAVTKQEKADILVAEELDLSTALQDLQTELMSNLPETIAKAQEAAVKEQEVRQVERKKASIEGDVREHLRGFSRTIPSFIMAYGDEDLTLANFDAYTPDNVFEEVTGITEDQFRFLRDGGDYRDEETGEIKHYDGHLFDEIVFNQSIQEFLILKTKLANYFDDSQTEDIFNYIPLQKTNQKFTPRKYVKLMVDSLEAENPDIFEDLNRTFFDPYVKSGLYLTEVAKKLYYSHTHKTAFPDGQERIKHILENQVFGAAPTEIIYHIAKTFVYGQFDHIDTRNLKQLDLVPAAKNGTMQDTVAQAFGGEKK
ncbi:DEAD/DEAH box helicase family protein [Streptococcus mutans]|uniref:DEAD/DEAH box helicase family protein n=1 Tax=Streptococcus mutans TaxID=1309 RepID=UPI0002B5C7FC|nr:DEAD/DEAH box helicase family protein [Streptococcus mutans]EMC00726.1 type II restriction endonuclease, putative [Streptococcus mutans T4]